MLEAKRAVFISLIENLCRERAPTVPGRIYCPAVRKSLIALSQLTQPPLFFCIGLDIFTNFATI